MDVVRELLVRASLEIRVSELDTPQSVGCMLACRALRVCPAPHTKNKT